MDYPQSWREMPEFEVVDFEDTWILGWQFADQRLTIDVELSLWPGHPMYVEPKPDQWTCYRPAHLMLEDITELHGLRDSKQCRGTLSPDGEMDYGNFDCFQKIADGQFQLIGEFGSVFVLSQLSPKLTIFTD